MKTTSEHISKQLAEIGFEGGFSSLWVFDGFKYVLVQSYHKFVPSLIGSTENHATYPAYDLETILEALPSFLSKDFEGVSNCLNIDKFQISYKDGEGCYVMAGSTELMEYCYDNMADAAAALLIKLHEKKLIKF